MQVNPDDKATQPLREKDRKGDLFDPAEYVNNEPMIRRLITDYKIAQEKISSLENQSKRREGQIKSKDAELKLKINEIFSLNIKIKEMRERIEHIETRLTEREIDLKVKETELVISNLTLKLSEQKLEQKEKLIEAKEKLILSDVVISLAVLLLFGFGVNIASSFPIYGWTGWLMIFIACGLQVSNFLRKPGKGRDT